MFLTRFRFNMARQGARRLLASPQSLHAAVMCSFAEPTRPDTGEGRVLWRVDRNSKTDMLLYIAGPDRPDLTHLVEQAGWPTSGSWQTYDYTGLLAALRTGDDWAFRLTANPVHSIRRKEDEPTKRTAHITPRHQMNWLLAQQERRGFVVLEKPADRRLLPQGDEYELTVRDARPLSFPKTEQASGRRNRVMLTSVTFDGRLRVTDPEALRRALTLGIGRAKAYGCGLMTLAPVTPAGVR
ncbi:MULTISPECIES: type I-E CRISPR-associated protein Cas6/Cse3/CasE [unclassified Streptomyces]|uniref:type I-E CRISPR-associated protein Cas6/Cse3/CasE n=1 Tax=unclassified Streptomyces TaxID=2593676 RepID=UPI002E2C6575|nr:type I-E CRISPR-associated protein Cas6/Cse3/CasE [Streptomyces sp. NBC_00223]